MKLICYGIQACGGNSDFYKSFISIFGLSVDVQSVWPGNKQVIIGKTDEEDTSRTVII